MKIKECTNQDIAQLALMNKHLIEDENSSNPMNLAELENRMRGFLDEEYKAYFFLEDERVLGYALVKHTVKPLYLRQFYIEREYRRRHCGKQAFMLLLEYIKEDVIDIDVLPWNEGGRLFWQSCGFEETCISMRFQR